MRHRNGWMEIELKHFQRCSLTAFINSHSSLHRSQSNCHAEPRAVMRWSLTGFTEPINVHGDGNAVRWRCRNLGIAWPIRTECEYLHTDVAYALWWIQHIRGHDKLQTTKETKRSCVTKPIYEDILSSNGIINTSFIIPYSSLLSHIA